MTYNALLTRTDKALPARQLAQSLVQVAVARGARLVVHLLPFLLIN